MIWVLKSYAALELVKAAHILPSITAKSVPVVLFDLMIVEIGPQIKA